MLAQLVRQQQELVGPAYNVHIELTGIANELGMREKAKRIFKDDPKVFDLTNQVTGTVNSSGLSESQSGIKVAGRNINNLIYVNDTILMGENEEEIKNLFMQVKEESEKAGLKLNIKKTKIMASCPIISWQIDGEKWKQ